MLFKWFPVNKTYNLVGGSVDTEVELEVGLEDRQPEVQTILQLLIYIIQIYHLHLRLVQSQMTEVPDGRIFNKLRKFTI